MNVDDLVFKKEDEVIYTDEKTGLAFNLPNNKMITIYHEKDKVGMVKLKSNMSMNKGDMKKVVKRINTDYGLDKKIIEDAFEVCEERLLLRPEPTMQGEDFKTKLLNKPDDKRALNELGQAMKQKYLIVRTENGRFYYFDGYFKLMDEGIYQVLIEQEYRLHLSLNEVKRSMNSISGIEKDHSELWEFNNCYYLNTDNYNIEQLEPQLTSRKFVFEDELLNYNPEVKYYNENPTLIEKTLREILVPLNPVKENPYHILKDFLYLLGWSLINGNQGKNIIIYYNKEGNNGKSVLGKILKCVFGEKMVMIQPSDFKDTFFNARIDDTNAIVIDEIQSTSLNGHWDLIKKIAGGEIEDNIRVMYSSQRHASKGNGTLFIMTNELPQVPMDDEALLYRLLIYELPNKFVNHPEPYTNEIKMNPNIFKEIDDDREGLEWLINASIKCYLDTEFDRPNIDTTKSILAGGNIIRKWLLHNTSISFDDYLTNAEIIEYIKDTEPNIVEKYTDAQLSKLIGGELKNIYGNKLEKNRRNGITQYNIELI